MSRIFNNILEIKENFDLFLFDAFGVFWNGANFLKGSIESMQQLVDNGKTVCILSNAPTISENTVKTFEQKGMIRGIHYNEFLTSGDAIRDAIINNKIKFKQNPYARKVYQFGYPNRILFANTDYIEVDNINNAELIYISTSTIKKEQYEKLKNKFGNVLFESKKSVEGDERWNTTDGTVFDDMIKIIADSKLPILNANPDFVANEGVKNSNIINFVIKQGYIAESLRKQGAEIIEYGKPHKEIYDFIFSFLENKGIKIDKTRTCMVGDTLRTDIKGANNAEIKSVLCLETGVTSEEIKNGKSIKYLIEKEGVTVDYFIKGVGTE
ncbi:MAG: HAD hydrolase-like protein [Rickettsiales bacterium]|jgi:HAD superfamily hydrolase (TIGR01450 family)|nr:HAD hydrolase-like protein [Rickettsiales bacterium]